jgi:hypothetical protein
MKAYVKRLSKDNKNFSPMASEVHYGKEDDVMEKINENVQKGSLLQRVISKNPHLLDINDQDHPSERQRKHLVTRGTQTYPAKVIPIRRPRPIERPKYHKAPIDVNNVIIPMNGHTPIPTYVFKSNKPSMLTRVKKESVRPLNRAE